MGVLFDCPSYFSCGCRLQVLMPRMVVLLRLLCLHATIRMCFLLFSNPTNGIFLHDFCLLDGIRSLIGGDNLTFAVTVSAQRGVGQRDNSFTDAPRTSNAYECKYHIYLLQ